MGKKYFRQQVIVTILSEGAPLEWDTLADIGREIDSGDSVGSIESLDFVILTPVQMAVALQAAGSDTSFFNIKEEDLIAAEIPGFQSLDNMIETVVDDMASWPHTKLLDWAQNERRDILTDEDPETIRDEWHVVMVGVSDE